MSLHSLKDVAFGTVGHPQLWKASTAPVRMKNIFLIICHSCHPLKNTRIKQTRFKGWLVSGKQALNIRQRKQSNYLEKADGLQAAN